MSSLLSAVCFALALSGGFAILYAFRLRSLYSAAALTAQSRADRYRPMLRLLSEEDLAPLRNNKKLLRQCREERVAIFRGYVKCLSRDYGRLLSAVSLTAVHSATDRPDLAWAVLRNRTLFACALCRLDVMVVLYRFGICGVDVSGLVTALESLRTELPVSMAQRSALVA